MRPTTPSLPAAEVEAATGAAPLQWQTIESRGYARNAARWRVALADGRSVFVKLALDNFARESLRREHHVYSAVDASFLPELVGWHDAHATTLLVLEDLSDAYWPPPWTGGQIAAVRSALDDVHATPPPDPLPTLESRRAHLNGWEDVAADPDPLLATRLCSRAWLDTALPRLREAAAACDLSGGALLHLDVRGDNLCFRDGRVLLVDWNLACVGNALFDVVFWLPSLRLEGGPEPWELVRDSGGLAAFVAGFFAGRAGLPAPAGAPDVRAFQLRQAEVALPWAVRELRLPPILRA